MALELYADKLPEDIREAFKSEIAKYVPVDSRDAAKSVLSKNEYFNAEFQAALSLKHEDSMNKFRSEKLPGLIEDEIKKRGSKQPWELEIEKLKQEAADKDRMLLLRDRKNQAITELAKHGIDPELADLVVHEDELSFKTNIERLTGKTLSWRDTEMKKLYGQKTPTAGSSGSADFSKMTLTEVMRFAGQSPANAAAVVQWQKNKR